jgi:hypothetical protein
MSHRPGGDFLRKHARFSPPEPELPHTHANIWNDARLRDTVRIDYFAEGDHTEMFGAAAKSESSVAI